jgi:hypothetical protein
MGAEKVQNRSPIPSEVDLSVTCRYAIIQWVESGSAWIKATC